jgi:AAA domain, putative AbiEii toxin, Type IV TA system
MLEYLHLENVGPAPSMELTLGSRLNLLTGDNGLGKSFLLDVAWWALTREWPLDLNPRLTSGYPAFPTDATKPAQIQFRVQSKTKPVEWSSTYSLEAQAWSSRVGRPWNPGLVIYALADGGFAVWDPARNYWKTENGQELKETVPAYVFSNQEVWNGLTRSIDGRPAQVCNGLLADWASWIRTGGSAAKLMADVLGVLSNVPGGPPIEVGREFARLSVHDVRDIPTIHTAYGQDVPIVNAALGIRRIAALAYILTWARSEHALASKRRGQNPSGQMILLFDEVEAHLHPRWQRSIVPSLLHVVERLTSDSASTLQVIAATHSPLVLASVEPSFDTDLDKLFTLSLEGGQVHLREQPWAKQGDVVNWLVSDTFGLEQGRSIEAERAIEAAEAWMRGAKDELPSGLTTPELIHAELVRVLAGHDPFWPRWIVAAEEAVAP